MIPLRRLASLVLAAAAVLMASSAHATRTLQQYRHFRALSVDLQGRIPSPDELAAFERDDFDLDAWVEDHMHGPAYAERMRRIYMDLLRLDIGPTFQFEPASTTLRREQVVGPDGRAVFVYYRLGQRRARVETDGEFCLSQDETGLQFPRNAPPTGTAHRVARAAFEQHTTVVHPWWLYRDYHAANPVDRYDPATWAVRTPGFVPAPGLLTEPDGSPTREVRVCAEEAAAQPTGTVFVSGRPAPARGAPPPAGRLNQPPGDSPFAQRHVGATLDCTTGTAFQNTLDCGCGPGLERCMPGDGFQNEPRAFVFPSHIALGMDAPFDQAAQPASAWERLWWGQEAVHFLDAIFDDDRDFRDVLRDRGTVINGPLAQFYRSAAPSTCCGAGTQLGYAQPEALFDPAAIPADLSPQDAARWERVADRGPHAAGLVTMPIFLTKYGSRRARAHALYTAFLCRDFVADDVALAPSSEPDLRVRPGCSTCHATLEPLAAYFSRVLESDWTFLPASRFPLSNPVCARANPAQMPGFCRGYYDPAFTDAHRSELRGAYASNAHADAGPAGLADQLVADPAFPRCVATNVAGSFLARAITDDDDTLIATLVDAFVRSGYRPRALVRTLVLSTAYERSNNLSAGAWRRARGTP